MNSIAILLEDEKLHRSYDGRVPPLAVAQDVVARARKSPFYSRKLGSATVAAWDDFFALPMTTKDELRAAQPQDTLAVPLSRIWHYHESFGTTGRPLATWFTLEEFHREVELVRRWVEPIKPGAKVLNRFPYSFAVPPFLIEHAAQRQGGVVLPAGNLNWNVSFERTLDIIKRIRPDVIACLPLEMQILELLAPRCGYDLREDLGSLREILVSGRILTPALKSQIERAWGAKVSTVYGMTECGGIASSCAQGRLHVHADAFILELVDPATRRAVAPGQVGILVATPYYRQGAPLLRYFTRDYARLVPEGCPCGDPNPVIDVLGRIDDTVELAGTRLHFATLEQAVLELAEEFGTGIYFTVVTKDRLHVRVESGNGRRRASKEGLERLGAALRVPFKLHIVKRGELLDLESLLRAPKVYKPHNVSDWRTDEERCVTLSEALLQSPEIGPAAILDIMRRAAANELLRKLLR